MAAWRSKKSESLEIRVSYEEKHALMQKAAREGRSASSVLRQLIAQYLHPASTENRSKPRWQPVASIMIAAGTLAVAYSVSSPATAIPDIRRLFNDLDKDGNGVIDREEYAHQSAFVVVAPTASKTASQPAAVRPAVALSSTFEIRGDFAGEDLNGDGSVSYSEFLAYSHALARRSFALMDANRNGQLSLDEFADVSGTSVSDSTLKVFEANDKNHDGQLTYAEFHA